MFCITGRKRTQEASSSFSAHSLTGWPTPHNARGGCYNRAAKVGVVRAQLRARGSRMEPTQNWGVPLGWGPSGHVLLRGGVLRRGEPRVAQAVSFSVSYIVLLYLRQNNQLKKNALAEYSRSQNEDFLIMAGLRLRVRIVAPENSGAEF